MIVEIFHHCFLCFLFRLEFYFDQTCSHFFFAGLDPVCANEFDALIRFFSIFGSIPNAALLIFVIIDPFVKPSNRSRLKIFIKYLMLFVQKGYLVNWDHEKAVWDYMFGKQSFNLDPEKLKLVFTEPYFNFTSIQEHTLNLHFNFSFIEIYDPARLHIEIYDPARQNIENCDPARLHIKNYDPARLHIRKL